jgi:hypothetical protein
LKELKEEIARVNAVESSTIGSMTYVKWVFVEIENDHDVLQLRNGDFVEYNILMVE